MPRLANSLMRRGTIVTASPRIVQPLLDGKLRDIKCMASSFSRAAIDRAEPERHAETIRKGKAVETRWIPGVPLRDTKGAALVNRIVYRDFRPPRAPSSIPSPG